jgi:hypothetical protein
MIAARRSRRCLLCLDRGRRSASAMPFDVDRTPSDGDFCLKYSALTMDEMRTLSDFDRRVSTSSPV